MRITKLLLICMCCLMAVSTVWGQSANSQAKPGILGYLDPHTGAFRPVAPPVDDAAAELAPAAATFTGTVTVTLTITVKTAGLTSVVCSADTSVSDNIIAGARSYVEQDTVAATGTGATRTCKLTIPYSWSLLTQASDSMTTSYTVTGSASATAATPPIRSSSLENLDTRKVPANGATTALTAAVTL